MKIGKSVILGSGSCFIWFFTEILLPNCTILTSKIGLFSGMVLFIRIFGALHWQSSCKQADHPAFYSRDLPLDQVTTLFAPSNYPLLIQPFPERIFRDR